MDIKYINSPFHPVSVLVIGAGGNGSQMIQQLGRINYALRQLNKPGLHVTLMDDDKVSPANCGRQLFNETEIGDYKSVVLISRINRFYGLNWQAKTFRFWDKYSESFNVIITCTDNVASRVMAHRYCKHMSRIKNDWHHERLFQYWIDMGNTKNTGQVICGSPRHKLPTTIDRYPKIQKFGDKDDTPSCSLAEALDKQDLYINTFVSNIAAKLFWEMCTQPVLDYCGAYINLTTFNIKKIAA